MLKYKANHLNQTQSKCILTTFWDYGIMDYYIFFMNRVKKMMLLQRLFFVGMNKV